MKLCVFQGTFNPIHNAHIRMANFVSENYDYDKILLIPAYCPPHKKTDLNFSIHRLNMVNLVAKSFPSFEVSDIEYKRKGTSYTYYTIKNLYSKYEIEGKIGFIIGTDAFDKIESWHRIEELKQLVKFIVFIREDNFDSTSYNYLRDEGFDFEFQTLSFEDLSSSQLRDKIKKHENIENLVTEKVKEYITKNGLYGN